MTAQLTFDDEFNSLSLRSGSTGTWSTRFWFQDPNGNGATLTGNGEQQWYINADYAPTASVKPWAVNNGVLTLTAQPASSAISPLINGYKYTSGEVNTAQSFNQTYGYFEMRAQLPAGQGLWPAFWLLPKDGTWPPELDVMEVLGKDPTKLYTTAHTNQTGSHTMATQGVSVANMSTGFHTYAVDWKSDKITFYFDNKQVYQTATPADMHKPMYMIANLAVGGYWPGSPDGSTPFPAQMKIDYVRAWNENPYTNGGTIPDAGSGGTTTPSSPATPGAPSGAIDGTVAADTIAGSDDHLNQIRGLDGNDRITGGLQANTINGNLGADTITGRSQVGDTLHGGQGGDRIDTSQSSAHNSVNGNKGADVLVGDAAGDTLHGGQGDDSITGGAGADWISGDRGHDVLTGGGGADIFHHFAGAGVSTITDFSRAQGDRIQLDPGAAYHATQSGADVVVDITGGGQLIIQHTTLTSLDQGWIFQA